MARESEERRSEEREEPAAAAAGPEAEAPLAALLRELSPGARVLDAGPAALALAAAAPLLCRPPPGPLRARKQRERAGA